MVSASRLAAVAGLVFFGSLAVADFTDQAARTSSRDVGLPRALVERIETEYVAYRDSQKRKGLEEDKEPIRRELLKVRAELRSLKPGTLHEDVRVLTPLGGGVVDLADSVTPLRGSFRARILVSRESGEHPENLRVFFVSGSRSRSIDGDSYGADCGKWMEITGFFNKAMRSEGFKLYTADQRYLSVLGGTFVLVSFGLEALSVASLSFTDSRYSNLLCE